MVVKETVVKETVVKETVVVDVIWMSEKTFLPMKTLR